MMDKNDIEQLFRTNSNCYADTGRFENDGSYTEGDVIQAMTEDVFMICIASAVLAERRRVWGAINRRIKRMTWNDDGWDALIDMRYDLFPDGEPK